MSSEPSFWSTVREALRGSEADLTAIPLRRAVLLLAVPMVLEMSMESLFAVADIFYVAKLGPDAVATVGLTESMLMVVYTLAMGLGAGATAVVARRTGEKDPEGAALAAGQTILLALVVSALIGLLGLALSSHLLALMGGTPGVVASGSAYTAIMFGGSATVVLLFVMNAIFRASGNAAIAMRALWAANLLNIALAPCFVFGIGPFPRMGVTGAAVATTLSRGLGGVAFQLFMLSKHRRRLAIALRHLVPSGEELAGIARIAASASLQMLVETASWIGLVRIVSAYGSVALAGYTIGMRVAIFALLPSWGLANAAATLVGQNLGAKAPDRAEATVKAIALYNVVFLGLASLFFIFVPDLIVGLFSSDPAIIHEGAMCLRTNAVGFVFFAYGMVMIQAFNGAGDTATPVGINIASFWMFKLPMAWLLSHVLGMGPNGVYVAVMLAYSAQSIIATILFRRGRWKAKVV